MECVWDGLTSDCGEWSGAAGGATQQSRTTNSTLLKFSQAAFVHTPLSQCLYFCHFNSTCICFVFIAFNPKLQGFEIVDDGEHRVYSCVLLKAQTWLWILLCTFYQLRSGQWLIFYNVNMSQATYNKPVPIYPWSFNGPSVHGIINDDFKCTICRSTGIYRIWK